MAYGNTKNRGLFIVLFMRTIALRVTASDVYCPAIADAHRGDGRRFIGRADEKVTRLWNSKRRQPVKIQHRQVQRQSLIRPCSRDTHPAQISADDVASKINGSADRFDCYTVR